jgi:hypothetical protein
MSSTDAICLSIKKARLKMVCATGIYQASNSEGSRQADPQTDPILPPPRRSPTSIRRRDVRSPG